jgi:hypothetical protein
MSWPCDPLAARNCRELPLDIHGLHFWTSRFSAADVAFIAAAAAAMAAACAQFPLLTAA